MSLPQDPGLDFADSEEYDPWKIVTKSEDSHGHSTTVRSDIGNVHVTKSTAAMINVVIQSNHKYTSQQAFVRDAIWHRLKFYHDNDGAMPLEHKLQIDMYLVALELDAEKAAEDAAKSLVESFYGRVRDSRDGSPGRVDKLFLQMRRAYGSMGEYPDLQERVRSMMNELKRANPLLSVFPSE